MNAREKSADKSPKSPKSPVKSALKRDSDPGEAKTSRSSSAKSEREVKLSARSPSEPSCSGDKKDRRLSKNSDSSKDTVDRQDSKASGGSPKVSRKYFTNWKQACDKTKDRTKELLKRWRTLPEGEAGEDAAMQLLEGDGAEQSRGWSVHVWTTWVNRFSEDLECLELQEERPLAQLSTVQSDKLTLFFTELEHDRDVTFCRVTATWVNRFSEDLECLELQEERPLAQLSTVQSDKLTLFFTELEHDRDVRFCRVTATWVNRFSEDLECLELQEERPLAQLSAVQSDKLTLFFTELLDHDRDDVIQDQDFDNFCEKLAHFADWSHNSSEYHILLEVKTEFIEHFINPLPSKWAEHAYYRRVCGDEAGGRAGRTTLEGWLARWALYLDRYKRFADLPLYLQYFCKILFAVVDRAGTGSISKPALAAFYRSVVGLSSARVDEVIDTAYNRLTSNEYLILDYGTYVHCFTNWLMGKNPNGPGQWLLAPPKDSLPPPPFPVDYSALNTAPDKLEPYAPDSKTNRHSVIV